MRRCRGTGRVGGLPPLNIRWTGSQNVCYTLDRLYVGCLKGQSLFVVPQNLMFRPPPFFHYRHFCLTACPFFTVHTFFSNLYPLPFLFAIHLYPQLASFHLQI